jgi:hypothetical protein
LFVACERGHPTLREFASGVIAFGCLIVMVWYVPSRTMFTMKVSIREVMHRRADLIFPVTETNTTVSKAGTLIALNTYN